jgi:tRNA A37 threonylcarbamoyladenosine synthetase subunit TsaC/SUA5/YrdC
MDLIKVLNGSDDEKIIKKFKDGEIGVILSDTIYGLSCSADKPLAVNKIYKIKNRPKNKFFIVLISDFSMLRRYFLVSGEQEIFLKKNWLNKKAPQPLLC